MQPRPQLLQLADQLGLFRQFRDATGKRHVTTDKTREALLDGWGFDVSTESAVHRTRQRLHEDRENALVEPVRIVRCSTDAARFLRVRVPDSASAPLEWRLHLTTEQGERAAREGTFRSSTRRTCRNIRLPMPPSEGYHKVILTLRDSNRTASFRQTLVVTPEECFTLEERIGRRRVYGILANLYSMRGKRPRNIGDFADLSGLIRYAGKFGAAFVGINPLHALKNQDDGISPYSPLSRLFRNVVYLDLETVPEYRTHRQTGRLQSFRRGAPNFNVESGPRLIPYPTVASEKLAALRPCFDIFRRVHLQKPTARGRAFRRFMQHSGEPLAAFSLFAALSEHLSPLHGVDWRKWPAAYRDPQSPECRAFQRRHTRLVQFHAYVQFELERQLATLSGQARFRGLSLGLYQDLALGSAADGADPWSFPGLFLDRIQLGCPPDAHSATGQNWSFPPVDPLRLRADAYRYWSFLLQNNLRHSGMVRIDHVMGLFRQFWIPSGKSALEGTYVRMPADELLGILALESRRHRTVLIGEDLGTVPHGLQARLAKWGILSSRVLMFERNSGGRFKPASAYSRRALVTANTHDLPPLAAWQTGQDLALRREIQRRIAGREMQEPLAVSTSRSDFLRRSKDIQQLIQRLHRDGWLSAAAQPSQWELIEAAYLFLANSPAPLLGVSLDDLGREMEPVNLPGISPRIHPSWSRRMSLTLDELFALPEVVRLLTKLRGNRRHP